LYSSPSPLLGSGATNFGVLQERPAELEAIPATLPASLQHPLFLLGVLPEIELASRLLL